MCKFAHDFRLEVVLSNYWGSVHNGCSFVSFVEAVSREAGLPAEEKATWDRSDSGAASLSAIRGLRDTPTSCWRRRVLRPRD